jgi:hypothetical protein
MSNEYNSINYIELPMNNNAGIKNNSTNRYLNGNLQIEGQIISAFPM